MSKFYSSSCDLKPNLSLKIFYHAVFVQLYCGIIISNKVTLVSSLAVKPSKEEGFGEVRSIESQLVCISQYEVT